MSKQHKNTRSGNATTPQAGIRRALVAAIVLLAVAIGRDSIVQYETALKADKFLVIAHGTPEEVARAKSIIDSGPATATIHTPSTAAA